MTKISPGKVSVSVTVAAVATVKTAATVATVALPVLVMSVPAVPDAQAQSLEDALIAAYMNNPALRGERASLRATDEGVAQALSNWRPTVNLTADTGREISESSARIDSKQNRDPSSYRLELKQSLFRGGRTLAQTSEAENAVAGGRARLTGVEQKTLLDAAVSYLNIARDSAVLDLNVNNEAVHVRQLEAARDRFQVGEITRTDVHQSEARLATAVAARVQSETTLQTSRSAYLNITGQVAPSALTMPPLPSGIPESREAAIEEAVANNPSVISARYGERAAIDGVDAIRGELLPEVGFTASTGRNLNSVGVSTSTDTHSAMLSVTVPLYQSGAVYSRLRAARQQVARHRMDVDRSRRNVTQEATVAWESLNSAKAKVESFRTAIQAAGVALDGVEREAFVGSRTVLDVLDAEQELLDARVNFIRARHDEAVAVFQLLSAVGRLTANHMQLAVDLYSPDDHYNEVRNKWVGGTAGGQAE